MDAVARSIRVVPGGVGDIAAALERLSAVLPKGAPELWGSLRPPVSSADLDVLRRATDPYELPDDVVTMLRWADGQEYGGPWWPSISCGALLSAARAAEHYTWLRDATEEGQWNPLWLPVAHAGWNQAGVEMAVDRPGAVIDASFSDPDVSVVAPSLGAMLDATADMIEAGLSVEHPYDFDELRRRAELLDAREDWVTWPYDRVIASEVAGWPAHWRVAIGLDAEPDATRLPAEPIREVVDRPVGVADLLTIEGYLTDRVLIDGVASGNSIVTLDDGTGAIRVLVQPDTPGEYWAAWLGRRIQIDVVGGDDADREIEAVIAAEPGRRERAPAGRCMLARTVRMGVQSGR
jgi:hypothetical protein